MITYIPPAMNIRPDHGFQSKEPKLWLESPPSLNCGTFHLIMLVVKNEPSFLRKLRSQYGDQQGAHHPRPNSRPNKPKDADDDDEPTYVDEERNEVVSKEEYEALLRRDDKAGIKENDSDAANLTNHTQPPHDDVKDDLTTESQDPKRKQQVAEIGGSKKRKQARVVGDDGVSKPPRNMAAKVPASYKPKQKKKIKLSFDEVEAS